jgi:hypothetical protein
MSTTEKRPAAKEDTYADCLQYLSADAEQKGLKRVASTLREARRKLSALGREGIANDNIQFPNRAEEI